MEFKDVSIVLEGGGARCAFTAGALDYFLEKDMSFPYVVGVSAGAITGANFVSRQYKRFLSRILNSSDRSGVKSGESELVDIYLVLKRANEQLSEFDFQNFISCNTEFDIGVMLAKTGESHYFNAKSARNQHELLKMIAASSSIPGYAKPVTIAGIDYFDGGYAEAIPLMQSFRRGYKKSVIILTRDRAYIKEQRLVDEVMLKFVGKYEKMVHTIERRHLTYNDTKLIANYMEDRGDAVIIAPDSPINTSALDFNYQNMLRLYRSGYEAAKGAYIRVCHLSKARGSWYD